MSATIPELRNRAWTLANNSVNYTNIINKTIYEGMENRPEIIPEIEEEEKLNFSLEYINKLISITKENFDNLKSRTNMINYIYKKHYECKEKYEILKGK